MDNSGFSDATHLLFTTRLQPFQQHKSKTNHSEYPDHRAIMVLLGRKGFSTSSQWFGLHYITGFQPTRHSSTNSITRQTIKEKVNSVTATHIPAATI